MLQSTTTSILIPNMWLQYTELPVNCLTALGIISKEILDLKFCIWSFCETLQLCLKCLYTLSLFWIWSSSTCHYFISAPKHLVIKYHNLFSLNWTLKMRPMAETQEEQMYTTRVRLIVTNCNFFKKKVLLMLLISSSLYSGLYCFCLTWFGYCLTNIG